MDGYLVIVFLSSFIRVCCSQECSAYEDSDVKYVCPELQIDNGTVCYDGIQIFMIFYWNATFYCDQGYYLHGSKEMLCRHRNDSYWIGETPVCYPARISTEAHDVHNTTSETKPTLMTTIRTVVTELSSLTTSRTTVSLSSNTSSHVPSRGDKSEGSTKEITLTKDNAVTETFDKPSTQLGPKTSSESNDRGDHFVLYIIVPSAVAASLVFVLVVVCCRRKYLESMLMATDPKYSWPGKQLEPSTTSTKDHKVILPVCDIKTITVLHDTSIYPNNNQWLVPRDSEPHVPYNEPGTSFGYEEGTVTNEGYEDEDYIHGIFQRLNYTSMGGMHGYATMSDTGVVSIPEEASDETDDDDANSKKVNQHQSVSSHSIQHNTVDDNTYFRLHRSNRRCSGDATYTHLYDNWLERHQPK